MIKTLFCGYTTLVEIVPKEDELKIDFLGQTERIVSNNMIKISLAPRLTGIALVEVLWHELVESWMRFMGNCFESSECNRFEPKFIINHNDMTNMCRDCTGTLIDILAKMKLDLTGNKVKK